MDHPRDEFYYAAETQDLEEARISTDSGYTRINPGKFTESYPLVI